VEREVAVGQLGPVHEEREVGTFYHIELSHELEAGRVVDKSVDIWESAVCIIFVYQFTSCINVVYEIDNCNVSKFGGFD